MSNDNDSHSAFYYYRTLLKMFHVEHIKPKRESFLFGFFSIQDFPNANENHSQMRMNRKWERFANENDSHLTHLLFYYFWRGGASSSTTTIFHNVTQLCVTAPPTKVVVCFLARGRQ